MTDNNGRDIIAAIPPDILQKVSMIPNSKTARMFLVVAEKMMVKQTDLCSIINQPLNSGLERAYVKLYNMDLVSRFIDNKRNIWYCIHPTYLAMNVACQGCTHARKKVIRTDKKAIRFYACNATVNCAYNYFRVALTLYRHYKAIHGLVPFENSGSVSRLHKKESRERIEKIAEDWTPTDFLNHLRYLHDINYPHVNCPSKGTLRRVVKELRDILEEEYPDKWKRLLKKYFEHTFTEARKNDRYVSPKWLTVISRLVEFASENKNFEMEKCEEYEIYCPYWKCGSCALKRQQGTCDKARRKMIRRSYN